MEKAAIVLRNQADGAEQTLMEIGTSGGIYGRSMCWSAEWGWADCIGESERRRIRSGCSSYRSGSGEMRRLTTPPPMGRPFGDRAPAISPDGRWMAFSRVQAEGLSDLYVVSVSAETILMGEASKLETGPRLECNTGLDC